MGRDTTSAAGPTETQFSLRAMLILIAAVAIASAIAAPFVRNWPLQTQIQFGIAILAWIAGVVAFLAQTVLTHISRARFVQNHAMANADVWGRPLLTVRLEHTFSALFRCLFALYLVAAMVIGPLILWSFLFPIGKPSGSPIHGIWFMFCWGYTFPLALICARGHWWKPIAFYETGTVVYGHHFVPWSEFLKGLQWELPSGELRFLLRGLEMDWRRRPSVAWMPDSCLDSLRRFCSATVGFDHFAPSGVIPAEQRDDVDRVLLEHAERELAREQDRRCNNSSSSDRSEST